jgi:hypothetical protein
MARRRPRISVYLCFGENKPTRAANLVGKETPEQRVRKIAFFITTRIFQGISQEVGCPDKPVQIGF